MKILMQIVFFLFTANFFAQTNYYLIDTTGINFETISENDSYLLDSLLPLINEAEHDTVLLKHLDYLVENCWDENIWPKYNNLILDITERNIKSVKDSIYIVYKANAINNVGYYYNSKGKSILALENYKAALSLFEKIGQLEGQSSPLNNLGYTYKYLGDVDKAIEYYHKSLRIKEQLGNEESTTVVINNLASLYEEQGDIATAKEYYYKTLEIGVKYNDKRAMSLAHSNLANLFSEEGKLDSALLYHQISYKQRFEIGYKRGMAQSLMNIGGIFDKEHKNAEALDFYLKALDIINDQNLLRESTLVNAALGRLYLKQGDTGKALEVGKIAYEHSMELGFPDQIEKASLLLSNIYKELERFDKSLEMYQLSIVMRDSIVNDKNKKAVYREQANYEFKRKENERKLEEEKKELIAAQEKEWQFMVLLFVSAGMVISILFLIFLYNRFLIIKKQKKLIDIQSNKLTDKNDELLSKNCQITDSIHYAKKIQRAVLPSKDEFSKNFLDSFIYYNPKDVVSGDFHWFYRVKETVVFTVADCTGHGVPGAFMSIIGNNLLDQIVTRNHVTQPDLILNQLNLELNKRMKADQEKGMGDGMDLAICSVNLKTLKLQFAGAHNSMYLLRDKKIIEFKADRLHIGNLENTKNKSFTLREMDLKKGDVIYVFSDGYADQKGGLKGKKFYYGPFRKLLIENGDKKLSEQRDVLRDTMHQWQGDSEQMDDMLILGVKI